MQIRIKGGNYTMRKFFVIVLLLVSCVSKYSKEHHVSTIRMGQSLYIEKFKTYSGGVFAGDSYSYYLTDSMTFRKYVGTVFHDDEQISCKLIGSNIVLVCKTYRNNTKDTLEETLYLLNNLKEKRGFD